MALRYWGLARRSAAYFYLRNMALPLSGVMRCKQARLWGWRGIFGWRGYVRVSSSQRLSLAYQHSQHWHLFQSHYSLGHLSLALVCNWPMAVAQACCSILVLALGA